MNSFYDFKICPPKVIEEQDEALGEKINGDRKVNTVYTLKFASKLSNMIMC